MALVPRLLGSCLAGFAAASLVACATPRLLTGAASRVSPSVTWFVPTEQKQVAITIDDGPDPEATPRILEVLAEHQAKATFFVIGSRIEGNEAILERIRAAGHEIANHTYTERASLFVPRDELQAEITRTHELLSPFGDVRWFRPGSGIFSPRILQAASDHGYRTALGDVFPFDPWIPSSRFHTWYILHTVRPGSVIVLHDANGRGQRTAATLAASLPELRERGYQMVTLSELAPAE